MRASSVDIFVVEVLKEEHSHLSSQEIFHHVQQKLPAVNPSTVYRSLDRLVNAGKVSISDMGTGSEVYELTEGDIHHHLVCEKCGAILTIHHEDVDGFFEKLEAEKHFKILTNHLVLFGLCEKCQAVSEPLGEDQSR
jgi:Fur family ferric uptake transcriptional regulator